MPVHVFPADGNRPARAFISCDKRDDIGRVPVELRRLTKWKITGGLLAKMLARSLGFVQPPQEHSTGKRWALGILKGKEHKGQVTLAVENGGSLKIAGHDIPLAEVLTLDNGKLAVDKDELLKLVDKPAVPPGVGGYEPSVARRESRKLDTQERYAAWRKAARELRRKAQGKSERWVSLQIAKMDIAVGRDAETIRKHIRQ